MVTAAGGRALARACLGSLRRHPLTLGPTLTWVVDNASADGTLEMVTCEFPDARLVPVGRNVGFAAANNVALRQVRAPYLLLLNPDTEVRAGALDAAITALADRPEVGVLGVRLERPDGSFDHAAKRSFPTVVGALAHFLGLGGRRWAPAWLAQYRAPDVGEYDAGEVDAVNGAFMLVRRDALVGVGLLDEGYGMYGEDLDWCLRFRRAGWTVRYEGGVTVLHVKGGTSVVERRRRRTRAARTDLAFHRAMGRFYRKFHGGRTPLIDVAVYAGIGAKLAVSLAASAAARTSLPGRFSSGEAPRPARRRGSVSRWSWRSR